MAGLFSIFNESENHSSLSLNKGKESQSFTSSKLKSFSNVGFKPKGLSIRSKSDLNVSYSNNLETNKFNSNDCLKPQVKQHISGKQFTMPSKTKMSKSKSFANIIGKKLSPEISSPIMQNVEDNFVFKKPEISKSKKKVIKCDEPENLSYYFDENKYMNEEMESIIDEDRKLLKFVKKLDSSITSLEDEGFISGSEIDSLEFQTEIGLLEPSLSIIELPEISDFED